MASATRSKSKPVAHPRMKRPAEDSDAESTDTDDVVEKKASRKPPTKRRKAGSGNGAVAVKKKRGGKLGALPDMPLDILEEIFSLLDPSELFSISRTTRAFRTLLLKDMQFKHLWAQAWARVDSDYPACPSDVHIYKWLHLLFGGPYCHTCAAPSVHRIHFSIRARMCLSCIKSNMLPNGLNFVLSSGTANIYIWSVMPAVILPLAKNRLERYVFPHDYTTFMTGIEEAERKQKTWQEEERAKKDYVLSRFREFAPQLQSARDCERWQDNVSNKRADNIEQRRSKRRSDIASKLRQLQYTDDDIASIWKLKDVNVAKPLTDRGWNVLLPTLLPTLNEVRSMRIKAEYDARHGRRLDAAREAWFSLMQDPSAIHPRELPYLPIPDQCSSLETISSMLQEDVEASGEWLERLQANCPEALVFAREVLAKRQLTAARMVVKDDPVSTAALNSGGVEPMQVLSRATSVFKIYGGENRARFGFAVLAQARGRPEHVDWTGKYDNESLWRDISIIPRGKASVEAMLKQLGLDLDTTVRELDRQEPIVVCMSCPARKRHWVADDFLGRAALGWRDMALHICSDHEKNMSDVQLRQLTEPERDEMAIAVLPNPERLEMSYAYGGMGWGCCHCTELMKSRKPRTCTTSYLMSRRALDKHLRECHNINKPYEDFDFYWHPYLRRGGPLKGYGEDYRIRVEEEAT